MTFNYLTITLSLITFLATMIIVGPNRWDRFYKNFTLLMSLLIFFYSLNIWFSCSWRSVSYPIYTNHLNVLDIHCLFTVDLTSLFFVLLTTFIFPFCILASWNMEQVRLLYFNLILIELCLVITFTVYDLFLFCVFFESVLIPMFFIIINWGSRERRIKALTYFFMYTLLGSVFLFLVMFALYFEIGSTSFFSLYAWTNNQSFFVPGLFVVNYIAFLLFLVFAIKIPVFPFHIWLPEAHVEAPTVGSVVLAGLLLKLGGYGVLRFSYMFILSLEYWQSVILILIIISIWLGSIIATRQLDLKRIIAYSSIAHMNFALVGVFSHSTIGAVGAYSLFLSHGVVSSALFLLIGFLYDRHHTRLMHYYGGLVQVMPLWVFLFFIFTVSNFSFPGTSNFVGELIIFISMGVNTLSSILLMVVGASTFLTVVYSLLMFNRVSFGTVKMQYITTFSDLTRREFFLMLPLVIFNFLFGFCPNLFIGPIYYGILWNAQDTTWPSDWLFETTHPVRHYESSVDSFILSVIRLEGALEEAFFPFFRVIAWRDLGAQDDETINMLYRQDVVRANIEQIFCPELGVAWAVYDLSRISDFAQIKAEYAPFFFKTPISLEVALSPITYGEEAWVKFYGKDYPPVDNTKTIIVDYENAMATVEISNGIKYPIEALVNSYYMFNDRDPYARHNNGILRIYRESRVYDEIYDSGKFLQ